MPLPLRAATLALLIPSALLAQAPTRTRPAASAPTTVGPPTGTVIVVGGGSLGPEIYREFIAAAGGPDALIITVPNSGGAETYDQNAGASQAFRRAGAKNVHVLHTRNRKLADTDSFVAIVKKAGGVWFDGGRQWNLVADYAGTKTEAAFNEVLARGGVVGGTSAGASILGDFLVRGAPSSNNMIMDHPEYRKGFSYLRNVAVDQHVVARERLPDLADSIIPRYPHLLGISEDEGTAWVIRGDTGRIIGRSKAFVYGARVQNDPGAPFLTLHPGDVYNLAERKVIRRAIEGSPLTIGLIDSLFAKYEDPAAGGATILVARKGDVLVNRSYGIPVQARYTPTTTTPAFALGGMRAVFESICAQMPVETGRGGAPDSATARTPVGTTAPGVATAGAAARGNAPRDTTSTAPAATGGRGGRGRGGPPPTPLQSCVQRVAQPVGMQKTTATTEGEVMSSVDALYRMALGIENPVSYRGVDHTKAWHADTIAGVARLSAHVAPGGRRGTFVRIPGEGVTIIVLTNDDSADAKGIADRVTERLAGRAGR